jgi:hypothetical protein
LARPSSCCSLILLLSPLAPNQHHPTWDGQAMQYGLGLCESKREKGRLVAASPIFCSLHLFVFKNRATGVRAEKLTLLTVLLLGARRRLVFLPTRDPASRFCLAVSLPSTPSKPYLFRQIGLDKSSQLQPAPSKWSSINSTRNGIPKRPSSSLSDGSSVESSPALPLVRLRLPIPGEIVCGWKAVNLASTRIQKTISISMRITYLCQTLLLFGVLCKCLKL